MTAVGTYTSVQLARMHANARNTLLVYCQWFGSVPYASINDPGEHFFSFPQFTSFEELAAFLVLCMVRTMHGSTYYIDDVLTVDNFVITVDEDFDLCVENFPNGVGVPDTFEDTLATEFDRIYPQSE